MKTLNKDLVKAALAPMRKVTQEDLVKAALGKLSKSPDAFMLGVQKLVDERQLATKDAASIKCAMVKLADEWDPETTSRLVTGGDWAERVNSGQRENRRNIAQSPAEIRGELSPKLQAELGEGAEDTIANIMSRARSGPSPLPAIGDDIQRAHDSAHDHYGVDPAAKKQESGSFADVLRKILGSPATSGVAAPLMGHMVSPRKSMLGGGIQGALLGGGANLATRALGHQQMLKQYTIGGRQITGPSVDTILAALLGGGVGAAASGVRGLRHKEGAVKTARRVAQSRPDTQPTTDEDDDSVSGRATSTSQPDRKPTGLAGARAGAKPATPAAGAKPSIADLESQLNAAKAEAKATADAAAKTQADTAATQRQELHNRATGLQQANPNEINYLLSGTANSAQGLINKQHERTQKYRNVLGSPLLAGTLAPLLGQALRPPQGALGAGLQGALLGGGGSALAQGALRMTGGPLGANDNKALGRNALIGSILGAGVGVGAQQLNKGIQRRRKRREESVEVED